MTLREIIGLICVAVSALLLVANRDNSGGGDNPEPTPEGMVDAAFERNEALWRQGCKDAAERLRSGELTTDVETRAFLAAASKAARRLAFADIAKTEQAQLGDGKWTAEAHAKILEGWADD